MQVRILSQIYPGSVSSHILLYLISNYIFAQMDMEIGMSRKKGSMMGMWRSVCKCLLLL